MLRWNAPTIPAPSGVFEGRDAAIRVPNVPTPCNDLSCRALMSRPVSFLGSPFAPRVLRSLIAGMVVFVANCVPPPDEAGDGVETLASALAMQKTLVASGLTSPRAMALAPDGRVFIAEHARVLVVKSGVLLPTPFVSTSVDPEGKGGLMGITLDPSFASNKYVYLYYKVVTPQTRYRVARYTAAGDVAAAGSRTTILDLDPLGDKSSQHTGGALHFGKDGKLYLAVGENGEPANAKNLATISGSCSASTRFPVPTHRTTTPSTTPATASGRGIASGRTGSVTRSRPRSRREPDASSSTTWARLTGKRSTTW